MHRLESTSDECFCFGYRAVGEQFDANTRTRAVLVALGRAKDVSAPPAAEPAPAAEVPRAARAPRKPRDPDAPKRAYRRRDMRAET